MSTSPIAHMRNCGAQEMLVHVALRFLDERRQRIRDVREGPDGLIYLLTDENAGAMLRIEPR